MSVDDELTSKPTGDIGFNKSASENCSLHKEWMQQFHEQSNAPLNLDSNGQYTVSSGDTLWKIAQRALTKEGNTVTPNDIGNEMSAIVKANKAQYPHLLKNLLPEMKLVIPGVHSAEAAPTAAVSQEKEHSVTPTAGVSSAVLASEKEETTAQNPNTLKPVLDKINNLATTVAAKAESFAQNTLEPMLNKKTETTHHGSDETAAATAVSSEAQIKESPVLADPDDVARAALAQIAAETGIPPLTPNDMKDPGVRKTAAYVAGGEILGVATVGLGIVVGGAELLTAVTAEEAGGVELTALGRGATKAVTDFVRELKPPATSVPTEPVVEIEPAVTHPAPLEPMKPPAAQTTNEPDIIALSTGQQLTVNRIQELLRALKAKGDEGTPIIRWYENLLKGKEAGQNKLETNLSGE